MHSPSPLSPPSRILTLPPELHSLILSHLDIPDLLSLSRTCHVLRRQALDPHLHAARLARTPSVIQHKMERRPELREVMGRRIYVTRTTVAAAVLGRRLIMIKLNRSLSHRPSAETLVEKGVLPAECYPVHGKSVIAPSLVEVKRRVEKERIKDLLRAWVGEWWSRGKERERRERREREEEKPDVGRLVRRFGRSDEGRRERERGRAWGGEEQKRKDLPTRAKVLGLRRFWEKVGRSGLVDGGQADEIWAVG